MVSSHRRFVSSGGGDETIPFPGRAAAFLCRCAEPGAYETSGVRYGPGSAAHRFARAARCAASGEREQTLGRLAGRGGAGEEGSMPRIALYPGSFDPVTNGHLDVIRHAVTLCDRLVVAIGVNPGKKPLFSLEERLEMVEAIFAPVAAAAGCGFERTTYDGLTVTAAEKAGATIMIRGLRDGTDLDYAMQLAG